MRDCRKRFAEGIVALSILILLGYNAPAVCFAANPANVINTPATPAEAATADVAGYRIVNGVAILPILPGNDAAVQSLLGALAQDPDFQGIKMTLYTAIGTKPKILLTETKPCAMPCKN